MAEAPPAWRRFLRNLRWGNPGKNRAWDEGGVKVAGPPARPPTKNNAARPHRLAGRSREAHLHGPLGDYYRMFAETAIRQMEEGTALWHCPSEDGERVLPRNAVTHRAYTAGNAIYLAVRGQDRGFRDNRWMTLQQIKEAGALPPDGPGERILVRHDRKGQKPVCRTSTVYNVEQVRGLNLERRMPRPADWLAERGADAVIAASAVEIKHTDEPYSWPYYRGNRNQIVLPNWKKTASSNHYYSTALRNIACASTHENRTDRWPPPRELLRADIATITVCDRLGLGYQPLAENPQDIRDPTGAPDYTEAWIKALKEDPREMHRAASEGHRIAEHLIQPARAQLRNIVRKAHAALDAEMLEGTSPARPSPVRPQPAMTPGR